MFRKLIIEYWLFLVQLLLALATLLILPLLIDESKVGTNVEILIEATVAVILFAAPLSLQLSRIMSELATLSQQKRQESYSFDKSEECYRELASIQSLYKDILELERGYVIHNVLLQELRSLKDSAEKQARYGRLEVSPKQFTTQPLLASLNAEDGLRFVHYADNNEFLFGPHSLDFMANLSEKINKGETGKARRLIVVSSDDELLDPRLWLFVTFHMDHPNYSYRLILKSVYEDLQDDHGLKPSRLDVGIYGEKYAYQSLQTPASSQDSQSLKPIGIFLAKLDEIKNLIAFYDHCWGHHATWEWPARFFSTIREAIILPPTGRFGRTAPAKKPILTVESLANAANSIQSLKVAFVKNGLTIEDLKNPNRV